MARNYSSQNQGQQQAMYNQIIFNAQKQAESMAQMRERIYLQSGAARGLAAQKANQDYQNAFYKMAQQELYKLNEMGLRYKLDISKMREAADIDVDKAVRTKEAINPLDLQKYYQEKDFDKRLAQQYDPSLEFAKEMMKGKAKIALAPEEQAAAPLDPSRDEFMIGINKLHQDLPKALTNPMAEQSQLMKALTLNIASTLSNSVRTSKSSTAQAWRDAVATYGDPKKEQQYYDAMSQAVVQGKDPMNAFYTMVHQESNPEAWTTVGGQKGLKADTETGWLGGERFRADKLPGGKYSVPSITPDMLTKRAPQTEQVSVQPPKDPSIYKQLGITPSVSPSPYTEDKPADQYDKLGDMALYQRLIKQGKSPEQAMNWVNSAREQQRRDGTPLVPNEPNNFMLPGIRPEDYEKDLSGSKYYNIPGVGRYYPGMESSQYDRAFKKAAGPTTGSEGFANAMKQQAEWELTGVAPGWTYVGKGIYRDPEGNTFNPKTMEGQGVTDDPRIMEDWFKRPFDKPENEAAMERQMRYLRKAGDYENTQNMNLFNTLPRQDVSFEEQGTSPQHLYRMNEVTPSEIPGHESGPLRSGGEKLVSGINSIADYIRPPYEGLAERIAAPASVLEKALHPLDMSRYRESEESLRNKQIMDAFNAEPPREQFPESTPQWSYDEIRRKKEEMDALRYILGGVGYDYGGW